MFQMAFFEPYIFSKLHAKNVPSKKICSCLFSNSLTKILNLRDSSQQRENGIHGLSGTFMPTCQERSESCQEGKQESCCPYGMYRR